MTDHTTSADKAVFAPIEPTQAGLKAVCPRCGQGRLFSGLLALKPACGNCGLDYSAHDVGDGAAIFVILIANVLVLGGALALENAFSPPVWVHILLWPVPTIVLCVWLTRLIKGVLFAHQYQKQAEQGRLDR